MNLGTIRSNARNLNHLSWSLWRHCWTQLVMPASYQLHWNLAKSLSQIYLKDPFNVTFSNAIFPCCIFLHGMYFILFLHDPVHATLPFMRNIKMALLHNFLQEVWHSSSPNLISAAYWVNVAILNKPQRIHCYVSSFRNMSSPVQIQKYESYST